MQAIILAAGMGRRLGEFTADNTKCMLEVNGVRLIDRMLHQLRELNLDRIVIVVGYEGDKLKSYILDNYPGWPIVFVENKVYDKTNNIYSLWLAKDFMSEQETLLLESDLIFEDAVLKAVVESKYRDCALVSKYETWMDGTMVKIDEDDNIVNFVPKKAFKYSDTAEYYKTVNIYKFSREFITNHYLPFLEAYIRVLGENEYYEQVLRVITLIDGTGIKALPISGKHWYEIDDVQDLRIAETIFAEPEEMLKKLQQSYGGYWRYPGLSDFCYLVNPYFPKRRMIEEMKANFEPLLRDYPSGMGVNSLLASKYFGLRHDYVVVGNGAAELIKSLMELIEGRVGVLYPTFEEYPNRLDYERIVAYHPANEDFSYTADNLIAFYSENRVENLLVVNPDNPSGNFIDREGLDKLILWAGNNGVRLIIDESFVDFSDESAETTLLHNDILASAPHLCVMKSISKSYGVPGLRLGVLASSDKNLIRKIRKDVGIWNINSFAEFYMQIFGKYEKDYEMSCKRFREERKIFAEELAEIPFLRVIPSQANYFLCEITERFTSYSLTLRLLVDDDILIKDCGHKKGFSCERQYVRIAIRDRHDNHQLYEALKALV
ncbi:MAG: aminotransferase class I/II-fold pyridoxal phosphate-dependent enzyme [Muribaculaceae bacterium]|nr:aminotransferase class I/II-fold pyridoxal phosphate-dependent enzyme [Muribaculaceae bacterium]